MTRENNETSHRLCERKFSQRGKAQSGSEEKNINDDIKNSELL